MKLDSTKILVIDGAMGTMISQKGISSVKCPELLNIEKPEVIQEIHREYIDAGADIIITNTFGANRLKLEKCNLENKIKELNIAGVRNAKIASKGKVLVAGNIGPTGELLAPYGDLTEEEISEVFYEQASILAEEGCDFIIIETMSSLDEIKFAVNASIKTGLPVVALMTFEKGNSGHRTMMGVSIKDMITELSKYDVYMVGTNCGRGINETIEIIDEMKDYTKKPLIAEPNAGVPKLVEGKVIYDTSAEVMAEKINVLLEKGVKIIGGCCGTTPEHIRKIRSIVDKYNN